MWLNETASAYSQAPFVGRRYAVLINQAYLVTDFTTDSLGQPWRKLKLPQRSQTEIGVGWSPLEIHELAARNNLVKVYPQLPKDARSPLQVLHLPTVDVLILNTTRTSRGFPNLIWRQVRYRTRVPVEAWVPAKTGIFRVGLSQVHLIQAYEEMIAHNLPFNQRNRLLNGVIQADDSEQNVRWAMGEPLRIHTKRQGYLKKQTIWDYAGLSVFFQQNGKVASVRR